MKINHLSTASAIVCAYNEEKNVAYILRQLIKSQLFNEIIAVDDGSTDRTPAILDAFGQKIKTIHLPENQGKSFAMVAGLQAATGQIIVFCDADLISIRKSHLLALLRPLQLDLADQVLAFRKSDFPPFRNLTGERAYRRTDLLPLAKKFRSSRYGVETFLNYAFRHKRTFWYLEDGLDQTGKSKNPHHHARPLKEFLYADQYLKEGYEVLTEIIRLQKPHLQKEGRAFLKKVKTNYQKYRREIEATLTEKDLTELAQEIKKFSLNQKKKFFP